MRVAFFHSNKPREINLAKSFLRGAKIHSCQVLSIPLGTVLPEDIDLACMVGVKSSKLWRHYQALGIPVMMFDKGYSRHKIDGCWEYWRLSYNDHSPTFTTLSKINHKSDRFDKLRYEIKPWRKHTVTSPILYAGSSAKYHAFQRMKDPTSYAKKIVAEIRKYSDREIIYRPKPSWRGAVEVPGTTYSGPKDPLEPLMEKSHAVITHGSNICFETMLAGIPCIVTGTGVARSISSSSISEVEYPKMGDREQLLYNLAYHQWTLREMASGEAWETIKQWL